MGRCDQGASRPSQLGIRNAEGLSADEVEKGCVPLRQHHVKRARAQALVEAE